MEQEHKDAYMIMLGENLLAFLKNEKADIEKNGLIATLDEAIIRAKAWLEKQKTV
jgi:hypothetical protein